MKTYTGEEALEFLAQLICRNRVGIYEVTVEVPTSGGASISYPNLELVVSCSEVMPNLGVRLDPPRRIEFVARGRDGRGPFAFVWPAEGVDPNQPACKGLAVGSVTVFVDPIPGPGAPQCW